MRLHPALALVVLLSLGTVASVAGATIFVAVPMVGARTAGALQDPLEQHTAAVALTHPSSDDAEGREFATKLLAARQENAQRQYEGKASVWTFMSVDLRNVPTEPAKRPVTGTRFPSAP